MIVLASILAVVVVILGYTSLNLLKKVEKQEDILNQYQVYLYSIDETIKESSKKLKEVDRKGMFSSDDEIGWFFEQVKQIQTTLDDYKLKEVG